MTGAGARASRQSEDWYLIRTNLSAAELDGNAPVRPTKAWLHVERAFRSMKTVDFNVRPVFLYSEDRVGADVFRCMLAHSLDWHMPERWKPLPFDDEKIDEASAALAYAATKAGCSEQARDKDKSKRADGGLPPHTFRTFLKDPGTLAYNINHSHTHFSANTKIVLIRRPTSIQAKAFALLAINPACIQ
ncbi:MAG: hypothetical protein EBY24_14190 [Betaproteobacteria bacterium]|nr:hypothetical protein [Betaproteobacteria bacterium]